MNDIGRLDWGDWLYGLFAAIIGGGASAVTSGFAASSIAPESFKVGDTNFVHLMLYTFAVSAILQGFAFLRTKPLPTVKTTVVEERSPHSSTVTTVVEATAVPPTPKP